VAIFEGVGGVAKGEKGSLADQEGYAMQVRGAVQRVGPDR